MLGGGHPRATRQLGRNHQVTVGHIQRVSHGAQGGTCRRAVQAATKAAAMARRVPNGQNAYMGTTILISAVAPIVLMVVITFFVLRLVKKRVGESGIPNLPGSGNLGRAVGAATGVGAAPPPEVAQLMATGAKARARVMNVRSTGVVINQINVRCEITFEIQPIDGGSSFSGSKVTTLSQTNMPRLGDQFPCWYDRGDPSVFTVTLVQQLTREHVALYREFGIPHPLDPGAQPSAAPAAPATADAGDTVDQLGQLATMHAKGQLTDDEFAAAKARLLG